MSSAVDPSPPIDNSVRFAVPDLWNLVVGILASINHKFPKKGGPKCPRNQSYSQFEIGRSSKSINDTVSGYHYPVDAVKHAAPFRQVIHVK